MSIGELVQLMNEAREAVASGDMTIRQLVGLTDTEIAALHREARRLASRRKLRRAAALCGLLCHTDPLDHRHWKALASMQRRLGQQLEADACAEVARCLSDEEPRQTRRRHA